MGTRFDRWAIRGRLFALLIVYVAPKLSIANPQRSSEGERGGSEGTEPLTITATSTKSIC